MNKKIARTTQVWLAAAILLLSTQLAALTRTDSPDERDRGDVPGWVMITVMTAIVVIALLAVFREQVVTAVQNAFDSVSNAK
ncbi:MAG: hypothetical protein ABWZ02_09720 [Nakamurella sp.]